MNFFLSPHQNPRRRGWLSQGKNGRDPLGGTDFCLDLTSLGVTNFGGCRKGVDQKELKFNNFTENNLHYHPMTTAAAIDRLVHHSIIFELNVESYRMEQAKKEAE